VGKTCKITKKCCICSRERHNLEFNSSQKGRTSLKPYCKHCKEIYHGIKEGLIEEKHYIGLDYNTEQLNGDLYGDVIFLKGNMFEKIPLEKAIRFVKQGGAHVTSESTIESIIKDVIGSEEIKTYVRKRDEHKCHFCVNPGNTVDHIIPKFRGGLDTPLNLVCCCKDCNELKGNMTKDEFLTRMKNGDYDYFKKTWKEHVKIKTFTKICKTCGVEKKSIEFDSQETNCKICTKLQKVIQLNLISKEKLKTISLDLTILKGKRIEVLKVSGDEFKKVEYYKAIEMVQKGLVEIVSSDSIKLLIPADDIQSIYPKFAFEMTEEEKKEQKTNLTMPITQMSHSIALYDPTHSAIGTIPRSLAEKLLSSNTAIILEKNRIKLLCSPKVAVEKFPILKDHLTIFVSLEDNETKLTNEKIEVRDIHNHYLNEINLDAAKEVVSIGAAIILNSGKIQLNMQKQDILNLHPTLSENELFSNEVADLNNALAVCDEKGEYLKSVSLKTAHELVRSGFAKVVNHKLIRLVDDVKKILAEVPEYKKIFSVEKVS
jgi:hypothetical protein